MKIKLILLLFLVPTLLFAGNIQESHLSAIAKINTSGGSSPSGISDDFSSDTSSDYTTISGGGISISSGAAYGANNYQDNKAYHETSTGSNDNYAVLEIQNYGGVICRTNGTTGYMAYITTANDRVVLARFTGSTNTTIGSPVTVSTNLQAATYYEVRIEISGTTIDVYADWNDDGDYLDTDEHPFSGVTDSTYSTGVYVGLHWYRNNGDNPAADNLSGGSN